MSGAAAAQDTDDEGVLPVSGSSAETQVSTTEGNGGNANAANQQLSTGSTVIVAGEAQAEVAPEAATLEFHAAAVSTSLITEAPVEAATFVPDPPLIAADESGTGPRLQGSGVLNLRDGLQVHFMPPQSATKSLAVIVLAPDGASLESELAGSTQPQLIIPLGVATPIDLNRFAAVTAKYGELLPGYHATIVFASVSAGELHVSAVRAQTEGGPLQVLVR